MYQILQALAIGLLIQPSLAVPAGSPGAAKLKVVKTTTTSYGEVIDWVVRESQGDIASPPPLPAFNGGNVNAVTFEQLTASPKFQGPAGTVPIVRQGYKFPQKQPNPLLMNGTARGNLEARDTVQGKHWYANSGQYINNHGGGADFNIYNPYVQTNHDFSLIQTAVARENVPHPQYGSIGQTVEAGWMHYYDVAHGSSDAFLFTFYNTDGYHNQADNKGGYNTDVKGWVQVDKEVHPGYHFKPVSSVGGKQYDIRIQYYLYQGNWWLFVVNKFIGYYPASLFSQGIDPAKSLSSYSDIILFYGEVTNSGTALTTTDMGSGHFPEDGPGKVAYMRNIHFIDTADKYNNYNTRAVDQSDRNRYRISTFFNSGKKDWESYVYLGGPGAGGVIGG